jgi:hypothetical protein
LVRSAVQPLGVIHETEQRTLLGDSRQQAEHGQGDQEPVASIAGGQAQPDPQSLPLGLRESGEPSKDRSAKLMHPGERQLHLSLDAADPRDTKTRSLPSDVPQQRRLSDARLATDDHDAALTLAHVCQQLVEQFALAGPAQEARVTVGGHHPVPRSFHRARSVVAVSAWSCRAATAPDPAKPSIPARRATRAAVNAR